MSKTTKHKKAHSGSPNTPPKIHKKARSFADNFQKIFQNLSRPDLNLSPIDEISAAGSPEKEFHNVSAKAREVKYNILEWILMKSIVFSLVVFLVFVILTHFVLNLAGGYMPVLILSVLVSIALRPTKEHLIKNIKILFGMLKSQDQEKYFFKKSLAFFICRSLNDVIHFKKNTQLSRKRRQKIASFFKLFSLTGDVYAILLVCICWVLISRFGISLVLYILCIIMVADFLARLLVDFLAFLINQFAWTRNIKVRIQKNAAFSATIDSTVATSVLLLFLVLSIGILIFMVIFLMMDIETIVFNLKTAITMLIQNINKKVSVYSGVENAIDENFVVSLIRNYNESIYSYVEKQELKGVYLLFSGALNSLKTNPDNFNVSSNGTSIPNISGLVENQLEFQECLVKNRLNVNLDIARDLEALYCSILPYANKFSIDPYTTFQKIKDGVGFLLQIIFGTILVEAFLISKAAVDYMFNFIVFGFCVFYLLHANRSAIDTVTSLLPLSSTVQRELHDSLVKSIKGSFLCSIKIFIYHFFFTWLIFDILKLSLGFTISLAAGVFSILPFIPSWCLCIPHAIYLYAVENNLVMAIILPVSYVLVSNKVYNDIYEKSIDVHPYVTGLSIVMGIYAFNVQGIIYGPLLMCIILIVIELIKKYGISTDTMLKLYRKRIYLEELESLEKYSEYTDPRRRSRSLESEKTPH